VVSSERGQVRMYQEKIAKWQTQVEERLRVLGQRSGEALYSYLLFSSIFLPCYAQACKLGQRCALLTLQTI
jgi:hypothetical protein